MSEISRRRGFAGLLPPGAERLPVAWHQVRIPGPPQGFALAGAELTATAPLDRFHRRMIQLLDCGPGSRRAAAAGHDRLALVDKVSPHALHDLMLSEVSERPKSTPEAVAHRTGRMLWQTGLGFVRFVSDADVRREFALDGAQCQLALNCDPNTLDRESVQAAKQFHLHLLCWTPQELTALAQPQRLGEIGDARMRRQFLDPLAFLGARLISEALAGLDPAEDPALAGAAWLPDNPAAVCAGRRPLGALLRLPGWQVLGEPGFEALAQAQRQAGICHDPEPDADNVGAGDQHLDQARENFFLCTDDIAMYCHWHWYGLSKAFYFSFLAFSTASSMLPTM